MSNTITDALNWRYATKKFDPSKAVSDADLKLIVESVRLAPTSFGLQPFRLVQVTDPAQREKLVAVSWGQTQVKDASTLLVFATLNNVDSAYVDKFIDLTVKTRGVSAEKLEGYGNMMKGFLQGMSAEKIKMWASKQAYIASGFLMETAALLNVDTCPMEGFDEKKYNEILGLDELGLSAALVMPVGYRATDDHHATAAKVRIAAEEMLVKI
ncbi:MAG: NAD(P)H-dependent oxidoreductase [Deltaproteobacteria bacterium CG11_big_fil_rev_8_21_14_0_20_47_16]|nr:MAG: NAD(P)H-dependent oxidoreductase [Deltaproteobacteria bacterium CG11_big_fil_rev_8_21_14_0_20_47_16]